MDDRSSAAQPRANAPSSGSPGPAPSSPREETTPLQRVGVLSEIPRLLREMNVDPDPVLDGLGVDRTLLENIEGRLPFSVVSALLLKGAEATGRSEFGLIVGATGRLDHLGVIGRLLASAPDFGAALMAFVANHPRYVRGASAYLIDLKDEGLLVGHRVHHPGLRGSLHFSAGAAAFGHRVFGELCGVRPTRALLSLPRPKDVSPYRRAFGRTKLVFEAEHFGLVYARSALATPIPGADPAVHAEIRSFVAERWNYMQPDLLDRLMRVLVPSVLSGEPSLASTADLLAMHPRTLNRALRTHGISFRSAVNDARFEMACQLLRDTGVSVGGLARILGYSEVSAFTRFFASMAGLSPTEWKQQELARSATP